MTKETAKANEAKITETGAVALEEDQLNEAQGGLLPAVKPTDALSLNFTNKAIGAAAIKLNTPSLKIG